MKLCLCSEGEYYDRRKLEFYYLVRDLVFVDG